MRVFYILRIIVVLAVVLLVAAAQARAQSFSLGVGVAGSSDSILVSNSFTYTISVTNTLTQPLLPDVLVTNVLPASALFVSATQTQGSYTGNGGVTVFDLGPLAFLGIAQMTLVVQMTAVGSITNTVTVVAPNLLVFPASTNVVIQVTNAIPPEADLGVTLAGPAQQTNIVNDPVTYGITATNLGPNDAPDVLLTNSLPPGVIFKNVTPTNQPYSLVTSNLIFNLGTLASGAGTNLQITVQPTNAGVFNFSASVGAGGVIDTNTANSFASTNLTVINYLSANLTVSLVTTQRYDHQNGLVEQTIMVSNIGTNAVPSVRVLLTGLTNRLFNASGTNSGNPFVVYATTLDTNQSVNLLLQFLVTGYFPLTNGELQAFGVPVPDLSPPAVASTSTNLNISRIARLANGYMLIEFPAITNHAYTVVYSDNVSFSNAAIAPPSIVAVASRLQWIDYGPPTTVSAPTNSGMRFYRVILNP